MLKKLSDMPELPAPHAGDVEWSARSNNRFYDFEKTASEEVVKLRKGITVSAQTHYCAVQRAAAVLGLAPEHITVVLRGNDV